MLFVEVLELLTVLFIRINQLNQKPVKKTPQKTMEKPEKHSKELLIAQKIINLHHFGILSCKLFLKIFLLKYATATIVATRKCDVI